MTSERSKKITASKALKGLILVFPGKKPQAGHGRVNFETYHKGEWDCLLK